MEQKFCLKKKSNQIAIILFWFALQTKKRKKLCMCIYNTYKTKKLEGLREKEMCWMYVRERERGGERKVHTNVHFEIHNIKVILKSNI